MADSEPITPRTFTTKAWISVWREWIDSLPETGPGCLEELLTNQELTWGGSVGDDPIVLHPYPEIEMTLSDVADEVANWHNNPQMAGMTKLYLEAIERAGFTIVRKHA